MSDLISRQAAIEALGEAPEVWMDTPEEYEALNQWEMDVAAIKAVPSAQSEPFRINLNEPIKVRWNDSKRKRIMGK